MKRIEIIANQSVQEDIVTALESAVEDLSYTLLPVVHGRGSGDRKLGTTVWPEENFVLFSYLEEGPAAAVLAEVEDLKLRYPREGIKAFAIQVG